MHGASNTTVRGLIVSATLGQAASSQELESKVVKVSLWLIKSRNK